MTKLISIIGLSTLVASCGGVKSVPTVGIANKQDAAKFANKTYSKLDGDSSAAPSRDLFSSTSNFTCATTGNGSVTAGIGTDVTTGLLDYTFKFSNCSKADDYLLDGQVQYKFGINTAADNSNSYSVTITLSGTIAAVFYNSDGSVDQSADVTYNNLSWTETGATTTVNGQTCYTWSATESGTITVGGTTYTPDGADFADSFLGTGSYNACTSAR